MKHSAGRYSVCDEARRAPNNSAVMAGGNGVQHWGEDGESERFDNLSEAQGFAKTLWEGEGRHHLIVIKDKSDGDKVVQAFELEPHDTKPDNPADSTRKLPAVTKDR